VIPAPIVSPRVRRRPRPRGIGSVQEAVAAISCGEMVVVIDSEDRENEGDLVMAADRVTPEAVNFMAIRCRGLICVPFRSAWRRSGSRRWSGAAPTAMGPRST
jgi:hypothetical protein